MKILLLEDSLLDAGLILREIKKTHILFEPLTVNNKTDYVKALCEFSPDMILSDHALPAFTSLEALKLAEEKLAKIPFIVVTGTMSEEFAVELMKAGAWDYVLKNNLQKLPDAIIKAMEKFENEKLRKKFLYDLILNEAYMEEAESIARYGSWEIDVINKKLKLSREAHSILGVTQGGSATFFENIMHIIHADKLNHVKRLKERVISNEHMDVFKEDFRLTDKDRLPRFIRTEFVLKHDAQKQLLRINGIIKNHIDSNSLEEKLLESEVRFFSLAESMYEMAVFVLNASGNIVSANSEASKMLEYSGDEIYNKHISEFYAKPENRNEDIINYLKIKPEIARFNTKGCFATKSGEKFGADVMITTQISRSGDLHGFILVTRKIIRSNHLQRLLKQLIK